MNKANNCDFAAYFLTGKNTIKMFHDMTERNSMLKQAILFHNTCYYLFYNNVSCMIEYTIRL